MAEQSFAMFGWSLTEASVLGSQALGQALMESCDEGFYQNYQLKQIKTRN